jgi:hypothetical protein
MYMYGFTSVSSTIHIVAAHPKSAVGVVVLVATSLLAAHYYKPTVRQAPLAHPGVIVFYVPTQR